MNLIDKDALIESLGIETDCYDCEHETIIYHCDLDPVTVCEKIIQAPVITVTTESAEKAIEVLKNAAWLGAVYSFEETEEAVKTAIRALQVASAQPNVQDSVKDADCISRQQAINAIDNANDGLVEDDYTYGVQSGMEKAKYIIEDLPIAQPNACENTCDFARKSNDMINRADAVDAISKIKRTDNWQAAVSMALMDLPSAQPEIIRCRDCKHYQFADNRAFGMPVKMCEWFGFEDVDDDDFCSEAERRTDERSAR
jgi:ribosomal protein S27E